MTNEQLQKIDDAIFNEINTAATRLDELLLEGDVLRAIGIHKTIQELEALREFVLEIEPDNDEPESVPNEALIAAKESYDQRVSSPEPLISERRLVYDGTNAPAFVRMLLGF